MGPWVPSVTLIGSLRALDVNVTEPGAKDLTLAHGKFLDDLRAGYLGIESHSALDAAAQFATSRILAGSDAIDRRRGEADPAPLVAAELAVWALANVTPSDPFFVY
jgi:hypothetical protein